MPRDATDLFMRSGKQAKPREWFRVENAWKDEESTDPVRTPIYIYDEIGGGWFGGTSADDFVQMLSTIKTPEIELHLNCPGGAVFDGIAIYNALMAHASTVHVVVDALAASAASFIAQAGNNEGGSIRMTTGAMMMIHDGSAMAYGPASVMRETADLLDTLSNNVAGIYAKHAGQTKEFWRNLMIEEVWYGADEAVAAGLATEVDGDTKKEDEDAAQNKWDLSVFNHAGRGAAPDPLKTMQRIANQLKENPVSEAAPEPEGQETGSPETDPNAQTTEGPAGEAAEEKQEEQSGGAPAEPTETTPTPSVPPTPAPAAPAETAEQRAKYKFQMGVGEQVQETTDFAAVQQRLTMLEQFRVDTMKASKEDFVKQLAADKKISASQIEQFTAHALKLDDAGYADWAKLYENAPSIPMLAYDGAKGGSGGSNPEGTEQADALATAKEIVAQHQLSRMSDEQIKKTASYQLIIKHEPNFEL